MRPTGSPTDLEASRRRAMDLLEEGRTPSQVAERLGVSRQTVQRWKKMVREGGKRALKPIPQHVPTCQMSLSQQRELGKVIVRGAQAAGFLTDLWTTARIAEVVRKKFKLDYNPDHLGRMLHRWGYSCQKPTPQAREHDARAERQWRKEGWLRIKKGRKTPS
jgi:transposase